MIKPSPHNRTDLKTAGFLLLGGAHHIYHLVPVAAALSHSQNIRTVLFVRTAYEAALSRKILMGLKADPIDIQVLDAGRIAGKISLKLGALLKNRKRLRRVDGLVVAERTSTILRYLPGRLPLFIHIPHGAGDRAKSYDPRIRHFDHVIVAGDKDKRRMADLGLVTEKNCTVSGYVKADAIETLSPPREPLFGNDNPVVIYNPHFDDQLSSWGTYGEKTLDLFSRMPEFNFIFAPHVRLFASASQDERQALEAFGRFDNIHIDLGSEHSVDMTYTRAADIYVGGVSSQVYEFLLEPRPCVFLAADEVQDPNDPDYAHWRFGDVAYDLESLETALRTAEARHEDYLPLQLEGRDDALGAPDRRAMQRAADCIEHLLQQSANPDV